MNAECYPDLLTVTHLILPLGPMFRKNIVGHNITKAEGAEMSGNNRASVQLDAMPLEKKLVKMEVNIDHCIAQSCGTTEITNLSPGAKHVTSILGKLSQ
jgi:hypothetical protein